MQKIVLWEGHYVVTMERFILYKDKFRQEVVSVRGVLFYDYYDPYVSKKLRLIKNIIQTVMEKV